jgi:hypothetical protein
MSKQSGTLRDRSRDAEHKARALSRRADRRAKSARLFLAFAFPAELAAFQPHA